MPPFHEEVYQSQQQSSTYKKNVFHRLYSHPTTELSRTQCKLQLQRRSYLTNDKDYLDHPQNMRRLTKELARIDKEYRSVRHFESPIRESLKRLAQTLYNPCLPDSSASPYNNSSSSSKRNSVSSFGSNSESNHINILRTSFNVEESLDVGRNSGVSRIDFINSHKQPLQYLSSSADARAVDHHLKGNVFRRWLNYILEDTFVHTELHHHHRQYNYSNSVSSSSIINDNSFAYIYHPTIANRLKR